MFNPALLQPIGVTLLTLGLAAGAIAPLHPGFLAAPAIASSQTPADAAFPDTSGHWAQPFIRSLANQNVVTGYPDGTYRPEQFVGRDEYAAIIRQAFNQSQERRIPSGSVYTDVPQGYWAAPAIEEAYEMGFMRGYPGGEFRPRQPVTRVEALASLSKNLSLPPAAAQPTAQAPQAAAIATPQQPQAASQRRPRQQAMYPMAMTLLMQPLMTAPARGRTAAPAAQPTAATAAPATASAAQPISATVSDYYADADQIPQYAIDDVISTTKAGIVVNHPDPRLLNPTRPATRGEIAAFIHQALVHQGRLEPISQNTEAAQFIVQER